MKGDAKLCARPSAYLKFWFDDGSPRCRVDMADICEPWLDALKPTITPLYTLEAIESLTSDRWRDIADAPKDGTDLLLAYRAPWDAEPYELTTGYWHDEWLCFVTSHSHMKLMSPPTHFMHLPEPPLSQKEK